MLRVNRLSRDLIKSTFLKVHQVALGSGIVVLPNHYYTPIADVRELTRTRDKWAKRSPMIGIDADLGRQVGRLQEIVKPFEPEYRGNNTRKAQPEASDRASAMSRRRRCTACCAGSGRSA